jgi:hypothetical protein
MHAIMSRDVTIEKWRKLLHRMRVCAKCSDCATCVGDGDALLSPQSSSAAASSPVTFVSTFPSSPPPPPPPLSSSSSPPPSPPPTKLFVPCNVFDQKDLFGNTVIEMDEHCMSLVTRHTSHVTRHTSNSLVANHNSSIASYNQLQWFKEACGRQQQQEQEQEQEQQQQKHKRVVEVQLPIDPETRWKVGDV